MIAALPMYDRPETAAANDRYWHLIRSSLKAAPVALTRSADVWEQWQSPDLVLGQTCGMPYRSKLHDKVTLVGTPDYGLEGCPAGHYRSVFVAHRARAGASLADFDGQRFAYNDDVSQSGWAAPLHHLHKAGLRTGPKICTGAHRESARAVAEGQADFASLDALSWIFIQRYDKFAADLVEIDHTSPTPALPYITARHRTADPLQMAITLAISDLTSADRDTLCLQALVQLPTQAYLAVPTPRDV